jgi:hypothetical protein
VSSNPDGWYPNPTDPNTEIYWDGAAWNGDIRDVVNLPAEPVVDAAQVDDTAVTELTPGSGSVTGLESTATRLFSRVREYPLWVKVAASALALGLVGAAVAVAVGPQGVSRAGDICREAAVDALRSPSSGNMIEFEVRRGPTSIENRDEWNDFVAQHLSDATFEQLSGLPRVLAKVMGETVDDVPLYLPDSYVGVGVLDGANGFGAVIRQSFVCGVVLDRTEDGEEAEIAFFG